MSVYTAFAANVLFPLHEWVKGHGTWRVRREMERTQWLPPDRLAELQVRRLRELLQHAARHVPYYRDLFARIGFDPAGVTSLAALQRLPVLDKPAIRANFDALRADNARDTRMFSTTGSTGDPLRFLIGKLRVTHDVAAKWRATRWWGVDIGDREMVAWSSPIELTAQDRARKLRDRLFRTRLVPAIALSPARLDAILEDVRAFRPTMLFGYPSSLALVAQRATERGVDLRDAGVKVAFATAEKLYPHQREAIARAFGCGVADGYGGRDSGFLAHQCPSGGMHITAEDVIVETVDERGRPVPAGEPGDVLVTHLFSHDFPFVRYANGDVAVLGAKACACGRGLPLVESVRGRTNDFLFARDGSKVHDVAFAMHLRDLPGVRQFKIIQETSTFTRLQLVWGDEFDEARARQDLQRVFRHHLGPDVEIAIERVAEIAPERSGKYRYVVNRLVQAPAPVSSPDSAAASVEA